MSDQEKRIQEIIGVLRYCSDSESVCGKDCPAYIEQGGCRDNLMKSAADRLESQEATIAALTARAEQAEAREKAAIAFITRNRFCEDCVDENLPSDSATCASCWSHDKKPNFRYRGLPQDGEGL